MVMKKESSTQALPSGRNFVTSSIAWTASVADNAKFNMAAQNLRRGDQTLENLAGALRSAQRRNTLRSNVFISFLDITGSWTTCIIYLGIWYHFVKGLPSRVRQIMLENLSIILLSITLDTTAACLKLCWRTSNIMLDWSWLYFSNDFSILVQKGTSISQKHNNKQCTKVLKMSYFNETFISKAGTESKVVNRPPY